MAVRSAMPQAGATALSELLQFPVREAKLGCVFTQAAWDKKGFPIRDPDSTTYTGAIETAEALGQRI
jgi:hypothetical protein